MSKSSLSLGGISPNDVVKSDDDGVVIGIDLGGTKILGGVAALDGSILATDERPTRHGAEIPVLRQIVELSDELCWRAGVERCRVAQVVVGVPGAVSPSTGLVSLSPNLALPDDRPLHGLLADGLGCPVRVENDVNLAAYGEADQRRLDAGALAFISFGTGVGMGLVIGNTIVRGASGRAGEIAFLPHGDLPHLTSCHSDSGLFEDNVGSPGIRALYGDDGVSVAEIFNRAGRGEARAQSVIEDVARIAAVGIASVQVLIDPDVIVLGGSIGVQASFLADVRRHAGQLLPYPPVIETSTLDRAAGMVGAVRLAAALVRPVRRDAS
ncbi:Transcriptional regulator ROK family [uncultured Pleomorphomonas sp.]|uniref:Transcriptional regulator ROK family n=1 Tax=uncultured Pleomorphomonas sp. TaxID=442121 RepID=A0A212L5X9_9HYPH|nr:ROK family protein [uncultured Pleomorphomonas sp.]SCM72973.1 Transcriptional regulator ROK family [uncultured Pleomorphomonas sp.]